MIKIPNQTVSSCVAIIVGAIFFISAEASASPQPQETENSRQMKNLFSSPDAREIVEAYRQRVANNNFEVGQISSIINDYVSFKQRVGRTMSDPAARREMERVLDEELQRYREIDVKLREIGDLLASPPAFNYLDSQENETASSSRSQ